VQKPHPPVIVGGAFPHSARRAIRYGDGRIPNASRAHYADVTEFLPQFRQMVRLRPAVMQARFRSRSGAPRTTSIASGATVIRELRVS